VGKGERKKVGAFILTRGLRHHRYKSFALTGFWQRAESEGQRVF